MINVFLIVIRFCWILAPYVLVIHSLLSSTTNLGFSSFEHWFDFFLSKSSHCILCNSALIFSSFSHNILVFLDPLCYCLHIFCLCITNTNIFTFGFSLMTEISLSFLHVPNMHSYLELIRLCPPILQNVLATIFVRIILIIEICQLML